MTVTDGDGNPIHPHALYQAFARIVHKAEVPPLRFHDSRRTYGSLLLKEGVPVKVVSERLGQAHIAHTIRSYQHLRPGMGADAARTYERLTEPVPTGESNTVERRGNTRRNTRATARPGSLTWAFAPQVVAGAGFEPATFEL